MRIEAKIMNRFLRTERAIYLMLSQLKGDRRHHSKSVSLIQGSGEFLRGWGNRYVEALVGQVLIGGLWNSAIYGQSFSTRSAWTIDPSLLKGFWRSSSSYALGLWFYGQCWFLRSWRSKFSPLCALATWLPV